MGLRMLARTVSASLLGVEGLPVRVEVDVAFGLPSMTIVGLAGSAVQEARERVRSALRNSGFELPARRITVNLAPADLPKEGTGYDLAIAIGILSASGQLPSVSLTLDDVALLGELALDGGLQTVAGAMALVAAARDAQIAAAIVPLANGAEAASVAGIVVFAARSLGDVVAHLSGVRQLEASVRTPLPATPSAVDAPDLSEVIGQHLARRALEIAIAGRHSLALSGPPGIGKTLILRAAAGLLPALDDVEAIEVSRIYSVAGLTDRRAPLIRQRPFRAPHHTVSTQALVGGGPRVRPGEASLAHRGVLFLDETLHFRADALDALRQPLESGQVTIARVDGVLTMPARFMLFAAFNPCPCGWLGTVARTCVCEPSSARRYAGRLSGPLRDRLDLLVLMEEPAHIEGGQDGAEPSAVVAGRIAAAWQRQVERQGGANAELSPAQIGPTFGFEPPLVSLLAQRGRRFGLSPRRLHRAARLARTIADLERRDLVTELDLDESLRYRPEAIV
jgi:magnesium chelatase family protein